MNTKLKSAIAAILSCAVTGVAAQPGGFDTMYLSQTLTEINRSSVKMEDWALGSVTFTTTSEDTPMVADGGHQFEILANLEWQDSITVKDRIAWFDEEYNEFRNQRINPASIR